MWKELGNLLNLTNCTIVQNNSLNAMINCERKTNCTIIEFNVYTQHYFTITESRNKVYKVQSKGDS